MPKKSVLVFVILSGLASALNYSIYPLFARIMPASDYIHVTVALSLFTQISTFLASIIAITIGLTKSGHGSSEKIEFLQASLFKLFLVMIALFLLASPIIMRGVNTPILFAIPISFMMLLSIPIQIIAGFLNGRGEMIKLGIVTVLSAACQFAIGITTVLISHNGLATLLTMSVSQILTLTIIYSVFTGTPLPRILGPLLQPWRTRLDKDMRNLLAFTALSAVSVVAISMAQVADILIVQKLLLADTKFYTDIYVISRIVFFAGMIFIWPFLGEISLDHHHFNRKPFLKVTAYFAAFTAAAAAVLYFFGGQVTRILFNSHYSLHSIQSVGILSITYKFFFLIITAVVLYFIVLRSYIAIWLSTAAGGLLLLYAITLGTNVKLQGLLVSLNVIAGALALAGIILLFLTPTSKNRP